MWNIQTHIENHNDAGRSHSQKQNDPKPLTEIEYDEISMKTKLVVKSDIIATSFVEKSLFNTILGFTVFIYQKKLQNI